MRQFPLHKLTIRYNAMFTYNAVSPYDLPCGSSPYINWLYGTMPQCLQCVRLYGTWVQCLRAGVPLAWNYTVQCHKVYVRFTMREFPLHKLTIRYNAKMFTYDLPCGSSLTSIDYTVQWHNLYARFTMREFPLHKLTIRYNGAMFTYDLPCGSSPYIPFYVHLPCGNWLYGTMAQCLRTIYVRCGSSPYINWLYGTMAQCLRTIYHAGVPLT